MELEFTNVAKNSTYVPCCFAAEARAMFPDVSFVDDTMPGATPLDSAQTWRQPTALRVKWPTHYARCGSGQSHGCADAYSAQEKA